MTILRKNKSDEHILLALWPIEHSSEENENLYLCFLKSLSNPCTLYILYIEYANFSSFFNK